MEVDKYSRIMAGVGGFYLQVPTCSQEAGTASCRESSLCTARRSEQKPRSTSPSPLESGVELGNQFREEDWRNTSTRPKEKCGVFIYLPDSLNLGLKNANTRAKQNDLCFALG